jgi:hypothetical protein
MDLTTFQTIAEQALVLLTLFATKAGDAVTGKIVDAGIEKGEQLYQTVFHHFQKAPDHGRAVKVLEDFKDDPEEYTINLRTHLVDVLQADPQFYTELRQFLGQSTVQQIIASSGSVVRGNKMSNTASRGRQIIQADDSRVEGNQMDIR